MCFFSKLQNYAKRFLNKKNTSWILAPEIVPLDSSTLPPYLFLNQFTYSCWPYIIKKDSLVHLKSKALLNTYHDATCDISGLSIGYGY